MIKRLCLLTVLLMVVAVPAAWGFSPTDDQATVNVRWPEASRATLIIEGQQYRAELGVEDPSVTVYDAEGEEVLLVPAGTLRYGEETVTGPGRVNIWDFGPQMYEVHLRDLEAEGLDYGEIELALYCYGDRIFVNLNVEDYDEQAVADPSYGALELAAERTVDAREPEASWSEQANERGATAAVYRPETEAQQTWLKSASVAVLAGAGPEDVLGLLEQESRAEEVSFEVSGGTYNGYQATKGYYDIGVDYAGPRNFDTGWINVNERNEVGLEVSSPFPAEIVCNVWERYGVLQGALLTDADGYPLPVPVQVSKNFGGEKEEGEEEGDLSYSKAYVPVSLEADEPFEGRVYHLFGNWGGHPLIQISSIRFFHHYFHVSCGPTETFCYTPFEFPREEGRNYIWADVRALSGRTWPGQPQHDHVALVGSLKYKSEGEWVNNLLQETRIYLTSPNLASFAMEYLSEDEKVRTTLEIFEAPKTDESRSFVRLRLDVLDTVEIDGDSGENLRFLNSGSYIVRNTWGHVAWQNPEGEVEVRDVPTDDSWVIRSEPLGGDYPFATLYPNESGNMGFFIREFEGRLGGEEVEQFGVSAFGDERWSEMFLTAPRPIERLEAGDYIEAHYFVMPYGTEREDYRVMQEQQELYGEHLAEATAVAGEVLPGYPTRVRADSRGFAHFTVADGDNWEPILIEGFDTHRGLMLWENQGGGWLLHDQQVHGNDWYQTYEAEDGSVGFVVALRTRPGMERELMVTAAPELVGMGVENGYAVVEGGPMDFVSPVPFEELTSEPLGDTGLFRVHGDVERAVSEQ